MYLVRRASFMSELRKAGVYPLDWHVAEFSAKRMKGNISVIQCGDLLLK